MEIEEVLKAASWAVDGQGMFPAHQRVWFISEGTASKAITFDERTALGIVLAVNAYEGQRAVLASLTTHLQEATRCLVMVRNAETHTEVSNALTEIIADCDAALAHTQELLGKQEGK